MLTLLVSILYGFDLNIRVKNIKTDTGRVYCSIFDQSKFFPMEESAAVQKVDSLIEQQGATCIFSNLKKGEYAVSIFHDEKNIQKIEKNWLGIPKGGLGCSKDACGFFSPPSFEKAKFFLSENMHMEIHLKYF